MRCPTRALTLSAALLALFGPIVAAAAQDPPAIHNSRLIYSAEEKLGRDLDRLLEASAPHLLPQRETLSHWAAFAGISPRVVLTLMELRSGAVRGVLANPLRPLGDQVPESGFSDQLREGLGQLADHFYAYRHPGSADDPLAGYPDYRAAEAASEALLRWLGSAAEVERFHTTYAALFPTAGPLNQPAAGWSPPLKATVPPANLLQLPYAVGQTWIFNGTHTYGGNEVGPKSSIDIARNWPPWGANTANDWVVAANAGTAIVHSSCYVEVLGSGGWSTTYYHLDNVIVTTGQSVGRNQRLSNYANNTGQALCNGGHSTGPHLHFSLKRNGQATSLADVSLSGYIVHPGRHDYDSNCDFMWLERAGVRHCAWNPLTNPGVTAAAPAAPSNLTADSQSSSEIELRWTDNANNETSFEIQRGQGGSFQTVATVGANTTR
ncbi:MAG: M23 family metallopeptidase, partial [Acidobacteriota bacterium]